MSPARRVACVLLPFAAGYYLSYLFRSINALIAGDLTAELGLSAADLGLLTSVYFLLFAAAQLPFGVLLDRHGPGTIQSALLLIAWRRCPCVRTGGWPYRPHHRPRPDRPRRRPRPDVGLQGHRPLVPARTRCPRQRLAGHAGSARRRNSNRAGGAGRQPSAGVACLPPRRLVGDGRAPGPARRPGQQARPTGGEPRHAVSLSSIYRDPRFWRLAPLSTLGIGTSWSLQGLWAAPWLRDVAGFDRATVVQHLDHGHRAQRQRPAAGGRRRPAPPGGRRTEMVLASTLSLSMAAQLALLLGVPLPSHLLCGSLPRPAPPRC